MWQGGVGAAKTARDERGAAGGERGGACRAQLRQQLVAAERKSHEFGEELQMARQRIAVLGKWF